MEKVTGGTNNTSNNPKGFKTGDSVYFFYDLLEKWMWGTFLYYDGQYRVRWNTTRMIYGGEILVVEADETSVPEQYIK